MGQSLNLGGRRHLLRKRKVWLGLAGSALFLGLFFRSTDFGAIGDAIVKANYLWLVPALAVYAVSVWFRSLRWGYLLRPLRPFSPLALYPYVVIAYMANNLVPGRIGELVRMYIISERYRLSKLGILATIALDRLFDGLILALFLAVAGAFIGLNPLLRGFMVLMAVAFVGALSIVFACALRPAAALSLVRWLLNAPAAIAGALAAPASPRPLRLTLLPPTRMLSALLARWQDRVMGLVEAFLSGLASLRSGRQVAAVLLTTAIAWALEATMYYLVGIAFHITEAFPTYLMVTAAANLAIALPSSQGGIGPFEFFAKETLVVAGVEASLASAYAVALHAVLLLPVIAAGLAFLWLSQLSLGEVLHAPAATAAPTAEAPAPRPVEGSVPE